METEISGIRSISDHVQWSLKLQIVSASCLPLSSKYWWRKPFDQERPGLSVKHDWNTYERMIFKAAYVYAKHLISFRKSKVDKEMIGKKRRTFLIIFLLFLKLTKGVLSIYTIVTQMWQHINMVRQVAQKFLLSHFPRKRTYREHFCWISENYPRTIRNERKPNFYRVKLGGMRVSLSPWERTFF